MNAPSSQRTNQILTNLMALRTIDHQTFTTTYAIASNRQTEQFAIQTVSQSDLSSSRTLSQGRVKGLTTGNLNNF